MLNGVGYLGNAKGEIRSWWMPRWCVYVRMNRQNKLKTYVAVNRNVQLVYGLPVIVRDGEIVGLNLGKRG